MEQHLYVIIVVFNGIKMSLIISIQGESLKDSLKKMGEDKLYDTILNDLGQLAMQYAKLYAPRDTGAMEDSIVILKGNKNELYLMSTVYYDVYNEFGTTRVPAGEEDTPIAYVSTSGKSCYRPFMRPAAIKAMRDVDKIIDEAFDAVWK